jgi:hypothetical protein
VGAGQSLNRKRTAAKVLYCVVNSSIAGFGGGETIGIAIGWDRGRFIC